MIIDKDPDAFSLAVDAYAAKRIGDPATSGEQAQIREVARQFEALLMHSLLKSMRATTSQDGLMDNDQTRLYTSLLDQEIAQSISKRGLGLAEILERQLSRYAHAPDAPPWQAITSSAPEILDSWNAAAIQRNAMEFAVAGQQARPQLQQTQQTSALNPGSALQPAPATADPVEEQAAGGHSHVQRFIEAMRPHATSAAERSGIPAQFLIGHAALESGWGRYQILHRNGESSHNLFGIKADPGWSGKVAEVVTTEYLGGVPVKRVEQFRAYDSYEAAFRDYADFLRSNPRYSRALEATDDAQSFASELQAAGYATDPRYADKLAAVINHRLLRDTVWA